MRGFEDVPVDWAPASVWHDDDGVRHQTLEFIVPGVPVPKGNIIKGRWGGYHDPTKGLDDWLALVSAQARAAMKGRWRSAETIVEGQPRHIQITPRALPLFDGAVMVDVTFVLKRPKSTPKRKTPPAIKKPDTDKLIRMWDAMTGIVWHDDAQVVEVHARKRLAYPDETPGAIIMVTSNVEVQ